MFCMAIWTPVVTINIRKTYDPNTPLVMHSQIKSYSRASLQWLYVSYLSFELIVAY